MIKYCKVASAVECRERSIQQAAVMSENHWQIASDLSVNGFVLCSCTLR